MQVLDVIVEIKSVGDVDCRAAANRQANQPCLEFPQVRSQGPGSLDQFVSLLRCHTVTHFQAM